MLLLTAILARKFNSTACEMLDFHGELDGERGTHPPFDPNVDSSAQKMSHQLAAKYRRLIKDETPEAILFRETYEHVLVLRNNVVHRKYRFRDPALLARIAADASFRQASANAVAAARRLETLRRPLEQLSAAEQEATAAIEAVEEARAVRAALGIEDEPEPIVLPEEDSDPGVFPLSTPLSAAEAHFAMEAAITAEAKLQIPAPR